MENANEEVVQLYLDDIIPNRFQPREVFDDQALKELAVSIREHGVIQPILVRKFGEKYEIIAGERRYKASTMAGLTKIPAIVKNLDDKEASKVALIENLQRRDLTPVEEARTYQKILDLDQMTQEQLAKTMGKSQSAVSNKLRLLTLPDEVQEALLNNKISERHARSLLNAPKNVQVNLLKEIIDNKMTVRELDSKIKAMTGETDSEPVSGGVTTAPVQDNNFLLNNGGNVMNNYDPTAVDINKIREQSVDINAMNSNPVQTEPKNIDSLLLGGENPTPTPVDNNRFIPDNTDTTIEKTEDGNEVIGNGLLAGMPVIQDTPNNTSSIFAPPVVENTEPAPVMDNMATQQPLPTTASLFNTPPVQTEAAPVMPEPAPVVDNMATQQPQPTTASLFNTPPVQTEAAPVMPEPAPVPAQPMNDVNSLFSTPAPEQIPIENNVVQQPQPTVMPEYGGSSGESGYGFKLDLSNIEIPQERIDEMREQKIKEFRQKQEQQAPVATVDVTAGVNEVKNLVASLMAQGYKVVVDELNLDNEVQVVVKFIKG